MTPRHARRTQHDGIECVLDLETTVADSESRRDPAEVESRRKLDHDGAVAFDDPNEVRASRPLVRAPSGAVEQVRDHHVRPAGAAE